MNPYLHFFLLRPHPESGKIQIPNYKNGVFL